MATFTVMAAWDPAPTRTSASVGCLMVISLIIIAANGVYPAIGGAELPARDTVVIFSVQVMTNPFSIWLSWFIRRHRLGYESLRPRTRQEFVRELGLALLWDIIQCWLGGVLFMGIAAAIWAPELLQVKNILLFILGTGVGQLCVVRHDGNLALETRNGGKRLVRILPIPGDCDLDAVRSMNSRIGVEVNIAIASVLAAASVATIALAYRRWCRADLD